MFRLMMISLLLLGLTGCMLGPDFVSPADSTDKNETFRLPDNRPQPTDTVGLAEHGWRQIYPDEQLQQLIEQGLKNNLDLQTARIRLAQAHAERTRARAPLFPKINVETSGVREQDSKIDSPGAKVSEEYILEGVLTWELDIWGINRRAAEVADANLLATEYQLYGQQVSIIAAIAGIYFDLQNAINRQKITESTITSRERALYILKLRKEGGIISGLDVRQAEVSLAQAQKKLPGIISEKVHLENALQILLGQKPNSILIVESLGSGNLPATIPVGLPSQLLERRPDIQVAEAELHAATAAIGIAKGAFFPKFTLTANYGRLSPTLNNLLKNTAETWALEGAILQPLFNAGANKANFEIAKLEQEKVLINYKKTLLTALAEVSDTLHDYYSSEDELHAEERLASSSREYLRLAQLRYNNGVLNYLDVLDAQRQLFDAELSLSDSLSKSRKALVQLYKALGGGW